MLHAEPDVIHLLSSDGRLFGLLFLFSKTEYHVAQANLKLMILHSQSLEYGEDKCTPSHLSQAGKTGSHVAQVGPEPLIPPPSRVLAAEVMWCRIQGPGACSVSAPYWLHPEPHSAHPARALTLLEGCPGQDTCPV